MPLEVRTDEDVTIDTRMKLIGAFLLPLGLITLGLYPRYASRYTITDKRLYVRRGLFVRTEDIASQEDVRTVSMSQGVLGRIFNYGTVFVSTAATAEKELAFERVHHPKKFQRQIQYIQQDLEKSRD